MARRRGLYAGMLLLALVGVFGASVLMLKLAEKQMSPEPTNAEGQLLVTGMTVVGEVMPKSVPLRLRVPAVNLDTTFEGPLGLNDDKSVQVPESFTEVGWYKYGPTPGELGPSVILGHVDSYEGPAVFWSLGQLKEGDELFVDREDGTTARFVITDMKRVSQDDFPTKEVYGDVDHAGLRIITCTGIYDHGIKRYSHNLIIFARLENVQQPTNSSLPASS